MAIVDNQDLKEWLSIASTDSVDVDNLKSAAAAADGAVKMWCRREFEPATTSTERWFEAISPTLVIVDDFSTFNAFVLATDDDDDGTAETVWAPSDYLAEPVNRIRDGITWPFTTIRAINGSWPKGRRLTQVSVTAQWGFAATPPMVIEAALIWAARLFRRKDTPQGIAGGNEFGLMRVNNKPDPDVMAMLERYRRPAVAAGAVLIGG